MHSIQDSGCSWLWRLSPAGGGRNMYLVPRTCVDFRSGGDVTKRVFASVVTVTDDRRGVDVVFAVNEVLVKEWEAAYYEQGRTSPTWERVQ